MGKTEKVVRLYRMDRELTLRKMADELSLGLSSSNGGCELPDDQQLGKREASAF